MINKILEWIAEYQILTVLILLCILGVGLAASLIVSDFLADKVVRIIVAMSLGAVMSFIGTILGNMILYRTIKF